MYLLMFMYFRVYVFLLKAHIKFSNLANFRIFGHSLVNKEGLEGFFEKVSFSLKIAPFTQYLTKSINASTHYLTFCLLYTNLITKI